MKKNIKTVDDISLDEKICIVFTTICNLINKVEALRQLNLEILTLVKNEK